MDMQQKFKELIKLYQRGVAGEPLEEIQLFAASVVFLENLKFALQDGEITRQMGMAMIELLRQHSEAYDRLLEKQKKSGVKKEGGSSTHIEQKRVLQTKLVTLAKDLGEFFQRTEEDTDPDKGASPPVVGKGAKARPKFRRSSRQNWLRS